MVAYSQNTNKLNDSGRSHKYTAPLSLRGFVFIGETNG